MHANWSIANKIPQFLLFLSVRNKATRTELKVANIYFESKLRTWHPFVNEEFQQPQLFIVCFWYTISDCVLPRATSSVFRAKTSWLTVAKELKHYEMYGSIIRRSTRLDCTMIRAVKKSLEESNCFLHVQSGQANRRNSRVYCSVFIGALNTRLITAEQFPTDCDGSRMGCWRWSHGSLQRDSSLWSCVVPVYQAHDRDVL